jgi:uncharacterized protein YggE
MRLVIGLALALGAAAVPAAAQSPDAPMLAPNEILFEITVLGRAQTPSDNVVVNLNFVATGPSAPAARAAAEALCNRLRAVAREFGAEQVPMTLEGFGRVGFVGDPITTYGAEAEGGARPAAATFFGNGAMRLRLRDPQRFGELRAALEQAGAINIVGPVALLTDETEARRAARLDALSKARTEAEQFARAQNLRVARMVRFSEATDLQAEAMRMMMSQMGGRGPAPAGQVETSVNVQVGFVLAPR